MESNKTPQRTPDDQPAIAEPSAANAAPASDGLEARFSIGRRKLALGGAAFTLFTVGIFAYQFGRIQPADAAFRWDQLQWRYVLPILLLLPVESAAAALRIWITSRVLHPGLEIWTCFKAEWSNVAVSTLTPSQTGGGPAQIYILSRAGVKVGTALTISLVSFMGTMAALFLIGVYGLFIVGIDDLGAPLVAAVAVFVLIALLMGFAARWPAILRIPLAAFSRLLCAALKKPHLLQEWRPPGAQREEQPPDRMGPKARRLADLIYGYRSDVGRFLSDGKRTFVWICSLSGVIFAVRALLPYFCLRFLGAESVDWRVFVNGQLALIFLIFFAPTPGAAGWAEGASMILFAELIPAGIAPAYNLLWRLVSLYIPASVGLLFLARSLAADMSNVIGSRPTLGTATTDVQDANSHQHNGRRSLP